PTTGQLRHKVINAFKDVFKDQWDGFGSIQDPSNGNLPGLFENNVTGPQSTRSPSWSFLKSWVAKDGSGHDNLCWIKGHPGSGKSVLMKFMVNQSRIDPSLLGSRNIKQPIILSHFYANDGNGQLAKNFTMINHLLFQLFTEEPQLVDDVFL
ncbi:hypothetical protein B0T20DRAFT_326393, partial [Sordaria brevicollis]